MAENLVAAMTSDTLEQIKAVCDDNAGADANHKMALDFVRLLAEKAITIRQRRHNFLNGQ